MIDSKHKHKFSEFEENVRTYIEINIVLESYNGAQILNNPKKKVSIISFSSQIFNERIIFDIGSTVWQHSDMDVAKRAGNFWKFVSSFERTLQK